MRAQTQSKPAVSGIFQPPRCFGNICKIYGTDTNILFFHYTTRTPVCQTPFYNFRTKTLCTNIHYFRSFYGKSAFSCCVFSIPLSVFQKMTISLHFSSQEIAFKACCHGVIGILLSFLLVHKSVEKSINNICSFPPSINPCVCIKNKV